MDSFDVACCAACPENWQTIAVSTCLSVCLSVYLFVCLICLSALCGMPHCQESIVNSLYLLVSNLHFAFNW